MYKVLFALSVAFLALSLSSEAQAKRIDIGVMDSVQENARQPNNEVLKRVPKKDQKKKDERSLASKPKLRNQAPVNPEVFNTKGPNWKSPEKGRDYDCSSRSEANDAKICHSNLLSL